MAIEFNVGEYARRLSRALTTRGRMPLDLDERIVPVAIVEDAAAAPFRQRGTRVMASFEILAADHVGTEAAVLVQHLSSRPGAPTDILVLDELIVGRITAGAAQLRFGYAAPQVNPVPIELQTVRQIELQPNGIGTQWQLSGDPSYNAVGEVHLGNLQPPSASSAVIPLGIVLTNSEDAAPMFFLTVPDGASITGFIRARQFSIPLS